MCKKPKWLGELKEFATRGNVIDMAVGVMIGGAFKAIVDSLVNDILSPLLGMLLGERFSQLAFEINDVHVTYGAFITAIINFCIMIVVIFFIIKFINALARLGRRKKEEAPAAPTTKVCPYCCSEIAIEAKKCPHCTSDLAE